MNTNPKIKPEHVTRQEFRQQMDIVRAHIAASQHDVLAILNSQYTSIERRLDRIESCLLRLDERTKIPAPAKSLPHLTINTPPSMSTDNKPRSDAVLKTLTEDRQAEIADFAIVNTLPDTVSWLQESGIKTSTSAVSRFLSWFRLKQQTIRSESAVMTLLDDHAISPETVQRIERELNLF